MEKKLILIVLTALLVSLICLIYGAYTQFMSYYTALESEDMSLCESINMQLFREACKSSIALSTDNLSYCDTIINQPKWEYCYYSFAVKRGDPDLCERIRIKYIRDQCYFSIE